MKEFKQVQKYNIGTPRKLRLVVALVKKLDPKVAVEKLIFVKKRASEILAKVIKAAIAQAKEAGVSDDNLAFKEIQISEGPRLKRGRAASRGRWHPYKKRMSHIRVILIEKKAEAKKETREVKELKKGKKNGTKS